MVMADIRILKHPLIEEFLGSDIADFQEFLEKNSYEVSLDSGQIEAITELKKRVEILKKKDYVKNQHYVPQFYLSKFTNLDGRLETLNLNRRKVVPSQSPKRVCSGMFFYSVTDWEESIISQVLEDYFCCFEDRFSEVYDKLVESIIKDQQIAPQLMYEVSLFASQLFMRWDYFREQMFRMNKDLYNQIKRFEPEGSNEAEKYLSKDNTDHLLFISDEEKIKEFASLLFHQKATIYIATGDRNFVTSNNALLEIFPHDRAEVRWAWGLHFYERLHYFALNPKILIEFDIRPGWPKVMFKKPKRKRITDEEVCYFNLLRSMHGREMYSCNKEDLEQKYYTISRINYVDELAKIVWTKDILQDKIRMDEFKQMAKEKFIDYRTNHELLRILGLTL